MDEKSCELCGRVLPSSFKGTVCAICKQEFVDLKSRSEVLHPATGAPIAPIAASPGPAPHQRSQVNRCPSCQKYYDGFARFCPKCGFQINPDHNQLHSDNALQSPASSYAANYRISAEIESAAGYAQASAIAWLVIGLLQVLFGLLVIDIFYMAIVGVWNIYVATTRFTRAREIRHLHPGIPKAVERDLAWIIVFFVLNFFFGAIIGSIGAILDLVVRDRILRIRHVFEANFDAQRRS